MNNSFNDLPVICGNEQKIKQATQKSSTYPSNLSFQQINSSFALALHMHQPTIPAGSSDLRKAKLISNLQYMLEHPDIGDNHNAKIFLWCYYRMSDFIQELSAADHNPRVMLDYSGNLLWGFEQMNQKEALDKLKIITGQKKYFPYLEWLGTLWSHAVVSSTPVPDIRLQIQAWQEHFASIFGDEALSRVKGFSAPEMHLPIHPDVCYEYIKALKQCGYQWLLVQEHTIENLDGSSIRRPHFPHRLVAKNSLGRSEEITVLIKTQGSDTKLAAQMQPYYEAQGLSRQPYAGKDIPPLVLQISDGENGGVMMNEFPSKYKEVFKAISKTGTVALNGSEYLEALKKLGLNSSDFLAVQPVSQCRLWEFITEFRPQAADYAIEQAKKKYGGFDLDKASWTNDKNWVKGYEQVLDPLNQLSAAFHQRFDPEGPQASSRTYQPALLYLLLSQTSCFRYWGEGIWTEYAKEICRRGREFIQKGG